MDGVYTMPERNRILRNIMKAHGPLVVAVGVTWMSVTTQTRLTGVEWLEEVLEWVPGPSSVDFEVGLLWVLCGLLMCLGGFLGSKWIALENAGYLAALCWPVAVACIFFVSFLLGAGPNTVVAGLSYLSFAAPYVGFLLWPPRRWRALQPELERARQEVMDSAT